MLRNESADSEQSLVPSSTDQTRTVEVPGAPLVRLQVLDLARHVAIDPEKRRFVVATFSDIHRSRRYITAIYPQQNGYLTLVRLMVHEFTSENPEQALQLHKELIQAIQQGKMNEFIQSRSK